MDLGEIRLLFDAGLFVLIWLVQLIIYPSFQYYDKRNLIVWHRYYTLRLSIIVIPLMVGQLILCSLQIYVFYSTVGMINLTMVILVWIITFTLFVPVHAKIAQEKAIGADLKKLVTRNWIRTTLWTLILGLGIYIETH